MSEACDGIARERRLSGCEGNHCDEQNKCGEGTIKGFLIACRDQIGTSEKVRVAHQSGKRHTQILWRYALSMNGNFAAPRYLTDADEERQVVWRPTRSNTSGLYFRGQIVTTQEHERNRMRSKLTLCFSRHLIEGGEVRAMPDEAPKRPWEQQLRDAGAHLETDLRKVANYINDQVVPEVRRNGSDALRAAAVELHRLAERMDDHARRNAAQTPPPKDASKP